MDLIALVCLFIVFALLLADQILSRRASGRERRHRERVQAREQRLRAEWDARQNMPPLR